MLCRSDSRTTTLLTTSHAVVGIRRGEATQCEWADWATVSWCRLPYSARVRSASSSASARHLGNIAVTAIALRSGRHLVTLSKPSLWSSPRNARSRHDDLDWPSVADAIVTSSSELTSAVWRRSTTTEQRRLTANHRLTTRRRAPVLDTWCNVDVFTCWNL